MHGEDLESTAFLFGDKEKVCYISDISRMLPETLKVIKENPVHILIVDSLCLTFKHPTHYSLEQAIELCEEIKPKKAFFVGMGSQFDHDNVNEMLKKYHYSHGLDLALAHDGLMVDVSL